MSESSVEQWRTVKLESELLEWDPVVRTILSFGEVREQLPEEGNIAFNVVEIKRNQVRIQIGNSVGNLFKTVVASHDIGKSVRLSTDAIIDAELAALGRKKSEEIDVFINGHLTKRAGGSSCVSLTPQRIVEISQDQSS